MSVWTVKQFGQTRRLRERQRETEREREREREKRERDKQTKRQRDRERQIQRVKPAFLQMPNTGVLQTAVSVITV
jgi:hypothetical protein